MKVSRKKSRSKAAAAPRHARTVASAPARVPVAVPTPAPAPKIESIPAPVAAAVTAPAADAPRARVVLGTSCTIQEAEAVRAHLLAQAALPGPYEIDGGSVEHVDTAGVQLVVAFALDCLEKGVAYKWTGRSPTLEKAIELLGVGPLLEYPA
jgi:phospholipid transport system transporter-binding protein